MHASFNTPRFRGWMQQLIAFTEISNGPSDILPPVTINDLGDMNMLTLSDLQFGTWLAINVWNGSKDSRVVVSINGSDPVEAIRTQKGEGEKKLSGPEYADPLALAMQATVGRVAFRSAWTDETAGHTIWTGVEWQGTPGPFVNWMLTKSSSHLWRLDMDPQMELGVHRADIETTDRYGRKFNHNLTFEVVESVPNMKWQKKFWEKKE